jgi:hypothetical protein
MTIKNPINYPLNKCLSSNQPLVPTNWNPAEHACQVANKELVKDIQNKALAFATTTLIDWELDPMLKTVKY